MAEVILRRELGVLRIQGKDGRDLVQRLSTNGVVERAVGEVVDNVITTEKGRIVDVVTMIFREEALWLVTRGPASVAGEWIDKMIFREDVQLAAAPWPVAHVLGGEAPAPAKGFVVTGRVAGVLGTHVIGPAAAVEAATSGLSPLGPERFEYMRVRDGIAAYGRELSEEYNPHEARLGALIDWEKGCYVGQEVVARLDTYKKVQRSLVRLAAPQPLVAGAALVLAGENVGIVTSAASLAGEQDHIALAYLKAAAADAATVTVGGVEARVLPWPSA
ncbi:MAG: hypothetical protein IT381_22795 [Deltaproteobacteria bacterium]|nr:hypothetical protein [Deltaproteobacteria bacterium]